MADDRGGSFFRGGFFFGYYLYWYFGLIGVEQGRSDVTEQSVTRSPR